MSPTFSNSKNFTEYDADLNIFNSDNESIEQLDKSKNLLDKLLQTVNAMKEELGKNRAFFFLSKFVAKILIFKKKKMNL